MKLPSSDVWEGRREGGKKGRREGSYILISASLKLSVTMTTSKTQIPWLFFSNFYKSKCRSQKIRDLQTTELFYFCLMSNTKILTTSVFDYLLLSPDVIILVEN